MDAALVVNTILGGGMSSRLFQKVREQMGLAYAVYSYISSFTEGGTLTVYAGVNPSSVGKAQDAIMHTIEEFAKINLQKMNFAGEGTVEIIGDIVTRKYGFADDCIREISFVQ